MSPRSSHCLRVLLALVSLTASLQAEEKIDYRQRLGSDGVAPAYPVPYTVPTAAEVKAKLNLVKQHVVAHTSLRVFDNAAGVQIATADVANPNPAAVLDGRFPHFNHWDYPNGVTWSAFLRTSEITGDRSYAEHVVRTYDFIFTWRPYFEALEKRTGRTNEFSKMTKMAALDHGGAITAGLIRTQLQFPDPRFRAWIDHVDAYISHGQFRLPDGTLARERPQAVSL